MSAGNTISLSLLLTDLASGPLKKIGGKADSFFNQWKKQTKNAEVDNKVFVKSIQNINLELDRLTKQRKITVDSSKLKEIDTQIDKIKNKKYKIESIVSNNLDAGNTKESKSSSLSKTGILGKLGIAGMGIGALYAAGSFASSSISDYNEAAQSEGQVKASLTSTKGISGKNLAGLKSQASELQGKTLFDDDVTLAADSILLTFKKVRGTIYDQAVPAIQDMATKMKMDLSSAALMVGKALEDPILGMTTLRRNGVVLSDTQKNQIKTFMALGQVSKAQAIILKELNSEFGGSAEAAAKAGTGGFTILSNKMKDFKEAVGERLTGKLGGLSSWLGKVVTNLKDMVAISDVEKLQDERKEVNYLTMALMDNETPLKRRNEIYDELKQIAPEVVAGLDKENVSLSALKDNLKEYNDQMLIKIQQTSNEKKLTDAVNEQRDAWDAVEDKRTEAIESINPDNVKGKLATSDVLRSGLKYYYTYFNELYKANNDFDYALKRTQEELAKSGNAIIANQATGLYNYAQYIKILEGKYDKTTANVNKVLAAGSKFLGTGVTGSGKDTPYPGDTGLDTPGIANMNGDISKVKNINISINKLGGDITFSNTTLTESVSKIKDMVTEVLLTAVNDANLAGGN
jgi:hypothetical protein